MKKPAADCRKVILKNGEDLSGFFPDGNPRVRIRCGSLGADLLRRKRVAFRGQPFLEPDFDQDSRFRIDPEGEGDLILEVVRKKDLTGISVNGRLRICFVSKRGFQNIPPDFDGALVATFSYEDTFPYFPALPRLGGLAVIGYQDALQDYSALSAAVNLKALYMSSDPVADISPLLPDSLQRLVMAGAGDNFDPKRFPQLEEISLVLRKGDPVWLSGLRNLRRIRARFFINRNGDEREQISGWLNSVFGVKSGAAPAKLPPRNKYYTIGYTLDVSESRKLLGHARGGFWWTEINESDTSDYIFFQRRRDQYQLLTGEKGVSFRVETEDAKGPLVCTLSAPAPAFHRIITALSPEIIWKNRRLKPASVREQQPDRSGNDPNLSKFLRNREIFRRFAAEVAQPAFEKVCSMYREQGLDCEFRREAEEDKDPEHYMASVYLYLWGPGRTRWSLLQYSHRAHGSDEAVFSVWDPIRWENDEEEVPLTELTAAKMDADLEKFRRETEAVMKGA